MWVSWQGRIQSRATKRDYRQPISASSDQSRVITRDYRQSTIVPSDESVDSLGECQTRFNLVRADRFFSRLFGVRLLKGEESAVLIPRCRCVHTFGVRAPLQLIFLSAAGRVLSVQTTRPTQKIYRFSQAASVLEIRGDFLAVQVDDYVFFHRTTHLSPAAASSPESSSEALSAASAAPPSGASSAPAGFSAVETLFALPILILLVMAIFQIGLLWHAKFSVTHAVNVAARNASLQHGSDAAIRDGLVQGLLPLSGKVQTLTDLPKGLFRSSTELATGVTMGWIRWEVLSPTRQSFADWGEPPDLVLNPSAQAADLEIPSAPLPALAMRRKPRSGSRGNLDGLPVGAASGQTLLDANTLKLHLQVGVPLQLPIVGNLMARSLAIWSGCALPSINDSRDRIAAINFGVGGAPLLLSSRVECRALAARDLKGRWSPRWPVEASAVVRMHSNARQSLMKLRDRAQ